MESTSRDLFATLANMRVFTLASAMPIISATP
jgi:hypothetical protein